MKITFKPADRSNTEAAHPPGEGANGIVVVSRSELIKMKDEILEAIDQKLTNYEQPKTDEILSLEEACTALHISKKQFYTIRKENRIEFSQIGRKIYVKRSAINQYLQQHTISKQ